MLFTAALTLLSLLSPGFLHVASKPITPVHKSPVTLPFARRMNVTGGRDIFRMDQARAKSLKTVSSLHGAQSKEELKKSAAGAAFGVPSTNQGVDYIVEVCHRAYVDCAYADCLFPLRLRLGRRPRSVGY